MTEALARAIHERAPGTVGQALQAKEGLSGILTYVVRENMFNRMFVARSATAAIWEYFTERRLRRWRRNRCVEMCECLGV